MQGEGLVSIEHKYFVQGDIITVRLKGIAPGFGPEARFYCEDGAFAILRALKKHRSFARGVLEDETGVIITEATQGLDPGVYLFTSAPQFHDTMDLSAAVKMGVSSALSTQTGDLAAAIAGATLQAQSAHRQAGRRKVDVAMPILYFTLLMLWLVWQRMNWLSSLSEAQNVLTIFRRVVQLLDIGVAMYWDPPKYWVLLKLLMCWE